MCSQWACRSLSVILLLFNFHLGLMFLSASELLSSPSTSPSPITSATSTPTRLPRHVLLYKSYTRTLVNECLLLSRPGKDVIVMQLSGVLSLFQH